MDVFPRLRDTLTRGFFPAVAGHAHAWIGGEIANAKPRQEFGVDRHYNRGSWQINPSSRTGLNSLKGVGDLV